MGKYVEKISEAQPYPDGKVYNASLGRCRNCCGIVLNCCGVVLYCCVVLAAGRDLTGIPKGSILGP